MEKDDSDKKVVHFSKMSTMVAIPHSGRSWYSNVENSLFRELFARSVDDLRARVSRGEVGCEIVGLEKHLTRDVSYHLSIRIRILIVLYQTLIFTFLLSKHSYQKSTMKEG